MRAERLDEIVFDDHRGGAAYFERRRRLGAAERTHELLAGGIPVGLAAAGRAVKLLARGGDGVGGSRRRGGLLFAHGRSPYCMNAVSCARVRRHCDPIFLPFRSPASRLAMT